MAEAREPRSRANKLPRTKLRSGCTKTKDPRTCPRCGHPCHSLVIPYYPSPWSQWGGFCCECATDAAEHFDRVGWPRHPDDPAMVSPPPT